jgi:hypothetical protein
MPQLVKGGKLVFGWVIVDSQRRLRIPPQAFKEYGFRAGEKVVFLKGSRRSGGFSVGRCQRLTESKFPGQNRNLGHGIVEEIGCIMLPLAVDAQPGDRLLSVRGSGLALGFVAKGPIYEEALKHSEVQTILEKE